MGLVTAGILLGTAGSVTAAGPLEVNGAGDPLKWDTAAPVPFNPDLGTLGTLTNAEATTLVSDSFTAWEDVPTSAIRFTNAGSLSEDVTKKNIFTYLADPPICEGLSPIIFDTDGRITDFLFGSKAGDSILGFAGPECVTYVPPLITEAIAILNGRFIDGVGPVEMSLTDFSAVFLHEFGHFFNLDHTQLNISEAFDGDPANDDAVPTMFPFLINGTEALSFHKDDEISVSVLYPEPTFFSSTGAITGSILRSDGATLFQGANVIVRNMADPLVDATSNVSGSRYFPRNPGGPPTVGLKGLYETFGLTPGADYTIEVEEIDGSFTEGSSVGPLNRPAALPGPPEFWNGINESGTNPPDDPAEADTIMVAAGVPVTGADILINASVDLSVTKSDSPDPVLVNGSLIYTIRVTNIGSAEATGINLTDTLPSGMSFISATPTQGTCSGTTTVTCSLGSLAGGLQATLSLVVMPTSIGVISNLATVSGNETDINSGNNSAVALTKVNAAPVPVTNSPPTAPELVLPAIGRTDAGTSVTFEWNRSTDPDGDAVTYDFYICDDPGFVGLGCGATSVTSDLTTLELKGIRASGFGAMLLMGFVVAGRTGIGRKTARLIPLLIIGMLLISCGDDDEADGSNPQPIPVSGEVTHTVSGLKSETTYYWKVIADDGNEGMTESETRNFTTMSASNL